MTAELPRDASKANFWTESNKGAMPPCKSPENEIDPT